MPRGSLELPLPPEFLRKDARRSVLATVFDANGIRLPGCLVEFHAAGPGGFVGTEAPLTTARTDHDGDALVTWHANPSIQALGVAALQITAECTESRADHLRLSEAVPLLPFHGN